MKPEFEECVHDIVRAENARYRDIYDIATLSRVGKPGFKSDVSDSPDIYRLNGVHNRDDVILFISNPDFPDFVGIAAQKSDAVVANIAPSLSRHVLSPVSLGVYNARSYALYPRLRTISKNRVLRKLQVATVRGDVFQWLSDVGASTQARTLSETELKDRFIAPYNYLLGEKSFSQAIRNQAATAVEGIKDGKFSPINVVQHGDFWHGNILLNRSWPMRSRAMNSFSIIDWGASNIKGYPYIDLLRFSLSIGHRNGPISQRLVRYDLSCAFSGTDLLNYVCAHAGYLGLNREKFPFERYLEAMETLFAIAVDMDQ